MKLSIVGVDSIYDSASVGGFSLADDGVSRGVLDGGGELGALMRRFDWSKTPLGVPDSWPQALKTCVRIVLTSRQAMFVWWGDELINIYNDAYRSILGGKHPHALGQPAGEVWREIWDQVGPRAQSAIRRNEGTYDEALLLIMERNGYPEETYYTFSYSPVPNDDGRPGGILCANTDDTQRIIGERQLALLGELAARSADARSLESACALAVESLRVNMRDLPFALIYLFDQDHGRATLAGASGITPGGVASPEVLEREGKPTWPVFEVLETNSPRVISNIRLKFEKLPGGPWNRPPKQAAIVPIPGSSQTGKSACLVVGLNPFRLWDDRYQGFLQLVAAQIGAAISNGHAYEEERKRAEALAEIDRAKTTFFSNVSHEFRTPLTLMLAPLEELLSPGATVSSQHRELINVAHRNGLRLLRLVNTLLDFSRMEAGRITANYQPTNLSELTADLASNFQSAMEKGGLSFKVDCAPLPEPVFVDHNLWEKIVLNLISNAFKFTFEGEVAVTLKPSADGRLAELTVRDTGTGIPAEEMPRLFDRFHRVEGARGRTHEGTGIGLALVKELVELHGGTVEGESELSRGSLFTVRLPFGFAHLPADQVASSTPRAVTTPGLAFVEEAVRWLPGKLADGGAQTNAPMSRHSTGESPGRVMIVDDNADMREYVSHLLEDHHSVIAVSNGEQALAKAIEDPPDLVISDVMMPGLDGFGLLQALRANPKTSTTPVLLLSARAGDESRVEGLEAGADDYLVKPFTARELLARVHTQVAMSRLRREVAEKEAKLRKEAEVAREQVVNILETMADGFVRLDREWRFTYVNASAERISGLARRDLLGKNQWEAFPATLGTSFEHSLRAAMTGEKPAQLETYFEPLHRWFDIRTYPNSTGLSIFFEDITGRKQSEIALRDSNEALRLANSDLEQFAFSASHDLQEPLRMVSIYSQLLKRKYGGMLDPNADVIINHCVDGALRMQTLIKDLLEYTRASATPIAPPPLVLSEEVLQSTLDDLRVLIEEAHASVTSDRLPQVRMEAVHLRQIFQNLITNAIKYRSDNRPEVRITAVKEAGEWIFSVSDNGMGIADDYKELVFGLFKRLHNGTKYEGTGLGLAICKRLIERYGGRIWLESEPGQGSTFFFTCPVAGHP